MPEDVFQSDPGERVFQPDLTQPWGVHITDHDVHSLPCDHAAKEAASRVVFEAMDRIDEQVRESMRTVVSMAAAAQGGQAEEAARQAAEQIQGIAEESARRAAAAAAEAGEIAMEEAAREAARVAAEVSKDSLFRWTPVDDTSRITTTAVGEPSPAPSSVADFVPAPSAATSAGELAKAIRGHGVLLSLHANSLPKGPLHDRTKAFLDRAPELLPDLDRDPDRPLTPAELEQAARWESENRELHKEINETKRAAVEWELRAAEAEARKAAQQVAALRPYVARAMRAAFRAGDPSELRQAFELMATLLDTSLGLHQIARGCFEEIARGVGGPLRPISELTMALNYLNRGVAAVSLVLAAKPADPSTTDLEAATKDLARAVGALSAVETLVDVWPGVGVYPHLGVYLNQYFSPTLEKVLERVAKLEDPLHERNEIWMGVEEVGTPANPTVEPGGRELGEPLLGFMTSVMRADSPRDVVAPSDAIAKWLVARRELLEAGTGGDNLPTSGWFRPRLDREEFPTWLHNHRSEVWAMLYGAMALPTDR
jgi:flagellar biosynthesis/type III secretory pathway protein FliH